MDADEHAALRGTRLEAAAKEALQLAQRAAAAAAAPPSASAAPPSAAPSSSDLATAYPQYSTPAAVHPAAASSADGTPIRECNLLNRPSRAWLPSFTC